MNFEGTFTDPGPDDEVRVTAASTADLLAGVWFSLGYVPARSLLLVALEGTHERLGLVLRADLPEPVTRGGPLRPLVRQLFEGAHHHGARAVVAIVSSEQAFGGAGRTALAVLEREAQATGVRLRDVLGVTATAFRSLRCSGPPCCPLGGRSIEAVLTSPAAATFVARGAVVADSETALVADVRSDPADPQFPAGSGAGPGAGSGAGSGATGRGGAAGRLPPAELREWWSRWTAAFGAARTAVPGDSAERSRPSLIGLSAALRDGRLRDAVVLHLLGAETRRVTELLATGRPGSSAATEELDRLMHRPPDHERLRSGEQVLAGCVRAAPPGDRSPALGLLALLAWYRGNGVRARLLVEEGTRDRWSVTWPGGETRTRADESDAGGGEGDGVSLLDLVEGLLVWAGSPPWVSDPPDG